MNTKQRAEWLKTRKTYIGGTDISAIAGVNKYKTALQVYLDKIGELPEQEENEAMEWGNRLEEPVAQKYADDTGYTVIKPSGTIFHQDYPFLGANIDRWVFVNDKDLDWWDLKNAWILECKTAGHFSSKEWGVDEYSEDMPVQYHTQVSWYSAICNVPKVDVAVLIGGQTFKRYTYNKDVDHEKNLIEIGVRFWKNHVEKRIPPEPTSLEDIALMFPRSASKSVTSDRAVEMAVDDLRALLEQEKQLQSNIDKKKLIVQNYMQENDTLLDTVGNKLATWSSTKPTRSLDTGKLKEEYADIYNACLIDKEGSRRFLIK